jgi:hypothetical protein
MADMKCIGTTVRQKDGMSARHGQAKYTGLPVPGHA